MKKIKILLPVIALFVLAQGCGNEEIANLENTEIKEVAIDEDEMMAMGDSIAIHTQEVLLKNVSAAMKEGGSVHAVDFCNTAAMPLTDSMSKNYGVHIQRVSDKNRNPQNTLATNVDQAVWDKIKNALASENAQPQNIKYLEEDNGDYFFYKPIMIGMPTCLSCHGGQDNIDEATAQLIAERYPEDQAFGYKMGELRGLWKIKVPTL